MKCPCGKHCTTRSAVPNCHTTCAEYLAFDAERKKICEKKHQDSLVFDAIIRRTVIAKELKHKRIKRK